MAVIKRFEDIRAWQEARKLTQQIYRLSDEGNFARDFGLRDQIRRAAVSIMANIAEGFDCDSQKEFARFLEIARRSTVEVQSLLYVALDARYIDQETFDATYRQTAHVKSLIHALRRSVLRRASKTLNSNLHTQSPRHSDTLTLRHPNSSTQIFKENLPCQDQMNNSRMYAPPNPTTLRCPSMAARSNAPIPT